MYILSFLITASHSMIGIFFSLVSVAFYCDTIFIKWLIYDLNAGSPIVMSIVKKKFHRVIAPNYGSIFFSLVCLQNV